MLGSSITSTCDLVCNLVQTSGVSFASRHDPSLPGCSRTNVKPQVETSSTASLLTNNRPDHRNIRLTQLANSSDGLIVRNRPNRKQLQQWIRSKGPQSRLFMALYQYLPSRDSPNDNPDAELSLEPGDLVVVKGEMDEVSVPVSDFTSKNCFRKLLLKYVSFQLLIRLLAHKIHSSHVVNNISTSIVLQDLFYEGETYEGEFGLVPSNYVEQIDDANVLFNSSSSQQVPNSEQHPTANQAMTTANHRHHSSPSPPPQTSSRDMQSLSSRTQMSPGSRSQQDHHAIRRERSLERNHRPSPPLRNSREQITSPEESPREERRTAWSSRSNAQHHSFSHSPHHSTSHTPAPPLNVSLFIWIWFRKFRQLLLLTKHQIE